MDKFGIFNLLSSLISGLAQKNGDSNADNTFMSPSETQSAETIAAEKRASFPPLKNSMLSTMKNHDEFYKRVMKNHASNIK